MEGWAQNPVNTIDKVTRTCARLSIVIFCPQFMSPGGKSVVHALITYIHVITKLSYTIYIVPKSVAYSV